MSSAPLLVVGRVVLPDHILERGAVLVDDGRITAVDRRSSLEQQLQQRQPQVGDGARPTVVDAGDGYILPGFVDIHVHGGLGADFMDGTAAAYETALRAHLRHGTTSLTPTTTVARHEQIVEVLKRTRQFMASGECGVGSGEQKASAHSPLPTHHSPLLPRVLGAHFYGPYFRYEARGAHPGQAIRPPVEREYAEYLDYADALATATIAPELPGAEEFAAACRRRGVRLNSGHSWCSFEQMRAAVGWGVRHVDHLYCAMSDKSRMRQFQSYPMQGGLLEATLYFDELTTEVIADGKHLSPDLLQLALKIKGPDRLALVTDCNRALDMPEGEYSIGPLDGGERLLHRDGVGLLPDGSALASSVNGMDHMLRVMLAGTGRPLWEIVRMATLTPARIIGHDHDLGSLEPGKRADVVVLDEKLHVKRVFVGGAEADLSLPR
ncbi:MAG: amidohydrolase family protein [Planctomycetes bacterium]|nr:amidohydrolase family protein [Planctomycetota bacterium]